MYEDDVFLYFSTHSKHIQAFLLLFCGISENKCLEI